MKKIAVCCATGVLSFGMALVGVIASPQPASPAPTCSGGPIVTCTFSYTGAVDSLTLPAGVNQVTIVAAGAQGGGASGGGHIGGYGAQVSGAFAVTGQTLKVVVGGTGGMRPGGGGGSFVYTGTPPTIGLLVAAAGGGGSTYAYEVGKPGSASTSATAGTRFTSPPYDTGGGAPGTGGGGGGAAGFGGGGGGLWTDGGNGTGEGGKALVHGAAGGAGESGNGGFGGGGGGGDGSTPEGGGGGGYNGGGGGGELGGGGGGGSFVAASATATSGTDGANARNGHVTITYCPADTCISGGSITGNVTAPAGTSLILLNTRVSGNVTANGARRVTICGSNIRGSVSITNSTGRVLVGDAGDDGSPRCTGNVIVGSTTLSGNTANVELGGNNIGSSATISNNTGTGTGIEQNPEVESNSINNNLSCSGNSSVSHDGHPNYVAGTRSGQCGAAGF